VPHTNVLSVLYIFATRKVGSQDAPLSLQCFELWHTSTVTTFSKDERTQTLCHVKCPAAGRTDVVSKIDAIGIMYICVAGKEEKRHPLLLQCEAENEGLRNKIGK
jgi:hypothetical protein